MVGSFYMDRFDSFMLMILIALVVVGVVGLVVAQLIIALGWWTWVVVDVALVVAIAKTCFDNRVER